MLKRAAIDGIVWSPVNIDPMAERAVRLLCWREDGRVRVETGAPYQVGRPDGSAIARVLADAGIYPSDLRRSPTLELAYAAVTSGLAPEAPVEAAG